MCIHLNDTLYFLTICFFFIFKEQKFSHLPFLGTGKSVPFVAKLNVIFRPEGLTVKKIKFGVN